jgi:hypothetical protein
VAKAAFWPAPDAEERKLGERTGLDTPVVLAVNVGYWVMGGNTLSAEANALSIPPGDYGRKVKTQRN